MLKDINASEFGTSTVITIVMFVLLALVVELVKELIINKKQ